MNILRIMVNDNVLHAGTEREAESGPSEKPQQALLSDKTLGKQSLDRLSPLATPAGVRENVRATLSPVSPISRGSSRPRVSSESRRSSFEQSRRSLDASRELARASIDRGRRAFSPRRSESITRSKREARSPLSPKPTDSGDSTFQSMEHDTESSAAIQSIDESSVSASQILNRSDVFQNPTIAIPHRVVSETAADTIDRSSQDTARSYKARPSVSPRSQSDQPVSKASSSYAKDVKEGDEEHPGTHEPPSGLRGIFRASAYPLQRAYGAAGYLRSGTKHMGNLLATESMGYYEKVSGMWAGGRKHYKSQDGLSPEDTVRELEDDEDALNHGERFRAHFGLPDSEELHSAFFCYYFRVLPLYGKIYISNRHFCYRSLWPGTREKVRSVT